MKNPKKFTKVVGISISAIVGMMVPVAALGYYYHAGLVKSNVLEQVDPSARVAKIIKI